MTNSIKGTHLEDVGLINLPSDWDIVEIQDLLSSDRGISVGVMYPGEHDPKGIPLVKVGDLTSNSINIYPDFYITPEKHYEYRRTAFEGGELLVTLVGALGHCAVVPESMRGWNAARAIAVLRLKNSQDAEFIRFCLLSPPLNKLINVWANTSVQATINLKEIKKLPIPFPEIKERTNIVDFLSCLDRKISNLRQQNKTLESIAQTLFKHWFVDFEFPNEDGKPYKSSGGAMVRSDLGDIPVSWRVGKLGEIALFKNGKTPPDKAENCKIPIYGSNGIIGNTDIFNNKKTIIIGRVGSYCGSLYYYLGKCWITDNAMTGSLRNHDSHAYLYFFLASRRLNKLSGGSGQPLLNQSILSSLELAIVDEKFIQDFEKIADPLFRKISNNQDNIQTLTKTRDRLLPKLMSGQLRIPE